MRILTRILGAAILLALAGFCVFGFLAAFEYPEPSRRWPWQAGYAMAGLLCLIGTVAIFRSRK